MTTIEEFFTAVAAHGGSTDVSTDKGGRYVRLPFDGGATTITVSVAIFHPADGGPVNGVTAISSPPVELASTAAIDEFCARLAEAGAAFNDATPAERERARAVRAAFFAVSR